MHIGYARVSTTEQNPELQVQALQGAGVQIIRQECRSGATARPVLEELLRELRPGDVLMVYKVDRLARSLADLLRVLQAVTDAGATFKSLTEPIETTSPAGRMLVQLLGAFAEFERAMIRERCAAGMVVARQNGVRFGRPPIAPERLAEMKRLRQSDQKHTLRAIAAKMGCCARTVARAVNGKR